MNEEPTNMDCISEFIGTEEPITHDIIPVSERQELVVHDDSIDKNIDDDYKQTRTSMKSLIDVGTDAIEKLAKVAEESESPRAYEVLSNTLKTITDMNSALMDLNKTVKDTKKTNEGPENVTNNNTAYIFNGTAADLQKALMKKDG